MRRMARARQVVAQGLCMDGGKDGTGHNEYSKQKPAGILTPSGML
jgi:hypothetical protein